MFGTVESLTISRLLIGVAGSLGNIIYCKSMNETFPEKMASVLGCLCNASICFGIYLAFLLGVILPNPEDTEANKEDEMWRVIYCFPAIVALVELLLILCVFRYDPVTYCISMGYEKEGKLHMQRVYRKKDPTSNETIDEILGNQYTYLKKNTTTDASTTTFS